MKKTIISLFVALFALHLTSALLFSDENSSLPDNYLKKLMQDEGFQKHMEDVHKEIDKATNNENLNPEVFKDLLQMGFNSFSDAVTKESAGEDYSKDIALASEYYQKAIGMKPEIADGYAGLASVYSFLGENDKAIKQISIALEKEPNNFRMTLQLIHYYDETGQYDLALEWWKKADTLIQKDRSSVNAQEYSSILKKIEEIKKKVEN